MCPTRRKLGATKGMPPHHRCAKEKVAGNGLPFYLCVRESRNYFLLLLRLNFYFNATPQTTAHVATARRSSGNEGGAEGNHQAF